MRTPLLLAVWALSLASCVSSRLAEPPPTPSVALVSTPLVLDSLAQLPAYLVPAPAGSTPRQRRQWQKAQAANLARSGLAPRTVKIKQSAVATGAGSTALTKPAGSVAAGAGAVATTVTKPKAPVAAAPGAVATATTEQGLSYWWLLVPVAGVLYWQRKRLAMLLL
ncbi:hypothetical protein I2I05_20235 [Hymenobacter sp. BT683]|uniref:Uncharacterized protein n=1 Tax=Hymenobacter jeongseonensis TaxID=2791027 RepID=A0ABS0IN00_9BACT|nr:hypothetical protein [Hymenobacter jeongseonensis]MBF9239733.1 hypothetical protein [Hymenobacter jeongseonensis]